MKILRNFVKRDYQDYLETAALRIPWYFQDNTCDYSHLPNWKPDQNLKETPFFVNMMVDEFQVKSDDFKYFRPLLSFLEQETGRKYVSRLFRFKANLYLKNETYPENCFHTPHVDVFDEKTGEVGEGEIFIYYADSSDGDTYLFREPFGSESYTTANRVSPLKGKAVLFDLQTVHASSPPRFHERRITLNFVFTK